MRQYGRGVFIPAGIDLERRIRRIWSHHRSQEVFPSPPCCMHAFQSNSVAWRLVQSLAFGDVNILIVGVKRLRRPNLRGSERQCRAVGWHDHVCAIGDISVLTGQLDEYDSVRRTCQGCDIGRYDTSSQSDTGAVYFCNDCETGRYMNVTGVSNVTQAVCERRSHDEQSRSHVNAHL